MRLWNVGPDEIRSMYNNKDYVFKPNQIVELADDISVFMLSKRQVRGMGLVQLKDSDNKAERYREGRTAIYNWCKEKWSDFEKHGEEREAQKLNALSPHKEIMHYKVKINDYENWLANGEKNPDGMTESKTDATVVYGCPYCSKTFDNQTGLKGHLMSHQKGKDVDAVGVKNKS
jgi:hypothetical protein